MARKINTMTSIHDASFKEQVLSWLQEDGEIICDVYQYGGYDFRLIKSAEQLEALFTELANRTGKRGALDVFRSLPFPIRGIMDSELEAAALAHFNEGQHWLILCPIEGALAGCVNWSDEATHAALRFACEEYQGKYVMIGPFIYYEDYKETENYIGAGFP